MPLFFSRVFPVAHLLRRTVRILSVPNIYLLTSLFLLLTTRHSPLTLLAHAQGISPNSIITTVAGGSWQFRGDGRPAVDAPLGPIQGIAVDTAGNIIAADSGNHIVVQISPAGILTVIAGNGIGGFSGEGGPAVNASLHTPSGVLFDPSGNLYIADSGNSRIRKLHPDGTIHTIAGNGDFGFSGDGGPATSAELNSAAGMALDFAGNLYIADTNNYRIRKVGPDGIIATVAGNGFSRNSPCNLDCGDGALAINASLYYPVDVAVDAQGNLYISDHQNGRIRKVNSSGIISTFAGGGTNLPGNGGPATSAILFATAGIAFDQTGNLYISARTEFLRKVTPAGIISTVAGNGEVGFSGDGGPATAARTAVSGGINRPSGVALDAAGNLYFADAGNLRIRKVTVNGIMSTVAGNGQFRFSGDGGPATSGSLYQPAGVTADAGGNIFVVDTANRRIRKITPVGIIGTVAGNGRAGFSGDGGPATSASLNACDIDGLCGQISLAFDATGNLYYADLKNNRVRRITPGGVISTVAGDGTSGSSGDGGPATSATVLAPAGLSIDAAGNLYIAEQYGNRVRKVTPSGAISTAAGDGTFGFSGDGGPATSASLNNPSGLAPDLAGGLYIADTNNARVRRLAANGVISTFAGNGTQASSGDGGTAANASLALGGVGGPVATDSTGNLFIGESFRGRVRKVSPDGIITRVAGGGAGADGVPASSARLGEILGIATDAAGNLYVSDWRNGRIRKVWATVPGLVTAPASLSFTSPAGAPVVAGQRVAVLSEAAGLQWSVTTATESHGNWLTVTPAAGVAPAAVAVGVNVLALDPGTYRGTVTVNAPLANPPVRTVAVTLAVEQALAPKLVAEPLTLTYETPTGASSLPAKTLRISNGGGGTVEWSAQVETSSGGNWLELSPPSGSVSPGSPVTAQVRVVPGNLAPAVYTGSIRISSSTTGQSHLVPVTLLIEQPTRTILVSQTGLIFTGVEGGAAVASQSFGIANIGQGEMVWNMETSTLSGGPNWLTVSPREGRSQAGSLRIPEVEVNVNVAGLRAGQYNGLLRVNALGASNGPQFVTVTLDMLPPGSNPGVTVRPTGMIFAAQAGTSSPSSQTVRLSMVTPGQVEARSGLFTEDGGNWIEILPPNALVSADDPRRVVVQPSLPSNSPGVYRGQLAYEFSDGSPTQRVDILFLVVPRPAANPSRDRKGAVVSSFLSRDDSEPRTMATGLEPAVDGCAPQRLHAVYRTISDNFQTPVGWPSPLEVLVADDCGGAVTAATVVASFSNGDPPLILTSLGNGLYVGTWRPATERDQVLVTVRAESPPLQGVELRSQGQVRANASVPTLFAGGIVNGASFAAGQPVTPGGIISVFGRNLARGLNAATQLPLEKSLGGVTLNIGGIETPLFFSSEGQINAQVPFELAPNTRPHVVVRTTRQDGVQTLTLPETITVAAARPAIFSINQQGSGQGAILNQDFSPNSTGNAAPRGSVIQIFATGLGATNPVVSSGQPAPGNPPALVTVPVEARIGGQPAGVQFAGLAPGFVGLYQVNVVVPPGTQPGPEIELTLTQNGVPSNTVTVAIR